MKEIKWQCPLCNEMIVQTRGKVPYLAEFNHKRKHTHTFTGEDTKKEWERLMANKGMGEKIMEIIQ